MFHSLNSLHNHFDLLFLDDLSHFMVKGHLHRLVLTLNSLEEDSSPLLVTPEDSLHKATAFQNGVVVPLNLEHAPVLLDVDSCFFFLITPLLTLTI